MAHEFVQFPAHMIEKELSDENGVLKKNLSKKLIGMVITPEGRLLLAYEKAV